MSFTSQTSPPLAMLLECETRVSGSSGLIYSSYLSYG